MAAIDVTVRGAGIFGLSVAWACARRGASVRVIDPHGVAAGASGGIVGALAPHVPETWNEKKAFQLDSLLAAAAFWAEVRDVGGADPGYGRLGRLQPVEDDAGLERARERADGAAGHWRAAAEWRVIRAEAAGTFAPVTPTGWLVHDTLSARIHPRRACEALAAALRVRGVEIVADACESGAVVWATGWRGLSEMTDAAGRPAGAGVKGQAALIRHDAGAVPQVFADGLHVVPHDDGTVAIGSTSERTFDAPDATDAQVDDLVARAVRVLPVLAGAEIVARWAGVRPRARSRAPLLGPWPGRRNHFVANGGFKIGFGMAPRVGDVMADLVLEARDAIPVPFHAEAALGPGSAHGVRG
ncbi:Hydrogen cyanide synthase subunit HcnC precursor [Roseivivax jejudonensis]|uniref:Hydrogen cyanide synthase subunit HcnC n=1 Tax=Roseivivax jejudonensis TaxID=1529041 RepID=A0A1X6ZTU4_9RHOB|nr:FAD-dependent oxidoreductase [Roseivivax jejudonensis]SLN60837.1 Hydrogen cyanide synthase subunit HcnC precursor [Roseivivax jejudonensis]